MKILISTSLLIVMVNTFVLGQVETLATLQKNSYILYSETTEGSLFFVEHGFPPTTWISDGTKAGTQKLVGSFGNMDGFTKIGEQILFFSTTSDPKKFTLYSYSPSTGVLKLKEVDKPLSTLRINSGQKLYFVGVGSDNRRYIWQSDGTPNGTTPLALSFDAEFQGFSPDPALDGSIVQMVALSDRLLVLTLNAKKYTIWSFEFATSSKHKVAEFTNGYVGEMIALDDVAYFAGYDNLNGTELWKTDGTAGGTLMVKDIFTGVTNGITNSSAPSKFRKVGNEIFFFAYGQKYSKGLWKTDGTELGTQLIKEVCSGNSYCLEGFLNVLTNKLTWVSNSSGSGLEPWTSDGTTTGTHILKDIWEGPASSQNFTYSFPQKLFFSDADYTFFSADDGVSGKEVYRLNNSTQEVVQVLDLVKGSSGSNPSIIYAVKNHLLVVAQDSAENTSLLAVPISELRPLFTTGSVIPNDYWFQTIGSELTEANNPYWARSYSLATDAGNNIFVSGYFEGPTLNFFDNKISIPAGQYLFGSKSFVSKLNQKGELIWAKQLHTNDWLDNSKIATDKSGAVYVASSLNYYNRPIDLNFAPSSVGTYLVKLSPDGKQEWLTQPASIRLVRIADVKSEGENIYVAGSYSGKSLTWQNQSISSTTESSFFVAKFNSLGVLGWLRNIENNWEASGELVKIAVNKSEKSLHLLTTEGTLNTGSSCAFKQWTINVSTLDFNGDLLWAKSILTNDLSVGTSLAASPTGDLVVVGIFRGELHIDGFSLKTDKEENCSKMTSFYVQLNPYGNTVRAKTDNPKNVSPYDIEFANDGTFVVTSIERISADGNVNLRNITQQSISRFDLNGAQLDRKELIRSNDRIDDIKPTLVLDQVGNVVMSDMSFYKIDTIANSFYNRNRNIFLLKTKLNSIELAINNNKEYPLMIFPNPTSSHIYFKLWDQVNFDFDLTIYDDKGSIVSTPIIKRENDLYLLSTNEIRAGVYLFVFTSNHARITKKIFIQH